jgi:hypothetical protein
MISNVILLGPSDNYSLPPGENPIADNKYDYYYYKPWIMAVRKCRGTWVESQAGYFTCLLPLLLSQTCHL